MARSVVGKLSVICSLALLFQTETGLYARGQKHLKEEASFVISNDEEAFFIRRIAEFWKDGDFSMVKTQIHDFLSLYPDSGMKEYLYGVMGDLALQDGNPQAALGYYSEISSNGVYEKIALNKMHAYYDLGKFAEIVTEAEPLLDKVNSEYALRSDELYFLVAEGFFKTALSIDPQEREHARLLIKADQFYQKLQAGNYLEPALFARAEIARIQEHVELASKLLEELAQRYPEKRENFLFQAATLQAKYAPDSAVETFARLKTSSSPLAKEAFYNYVALLFQKEQYDLVLEELKKQPDALSYDLQHSLEYISGKSHYAKNHFDEAIKYLKKFIKTEDAQSEQKRNALLLLMSCGYEKKQPDLVKESLTTFKASYPDDSKVCEAMLLEATLLREMGRYAESQIRLDEIALYDPSYASKENYLIQAAFTAYEQKEWSRAYECAARVVESENNSPHLYPVKKLLFSAAIHRLESRDESYTKAMLMKDLEIAVSRKDLLTEKELLSYQLLYTKTLFDYGRVNDAYSYLTSEVMPAIAVEDVVSRADAEYLAAMCKHELHDNPAAFCEHLEKAKTLLSEKYDHSATYLHLFNGYLAQAKVEEEMKGDISVAKALKEKAAESMYTAFKLGETSILDTNMAWLADFYFDTVHEAVEERGDLAFTEPHVLEASSRAASLYDANLLSQRHLKAISQSNLFLESSAIKYSQLLGLLGKNKEKEQILSQLLRMQTEQEDVQWQYQSVCFFELGNAYKELGKLEKAVETFKFIAAGTKDLSSKISLEASYQLASLGYALLDTTKRSQDNPELQAILTKFKDLQIRKHPLSEPLHLESALTYASIRRDLAKKEEKIDKQLFFLDRIKEDFLSENDDLSKEYHSYLESNQKFKHIFESYMSYIDAEKFRLEAMKLGKGEKFTEVEDFQEKALSLLGELKADEHLPSALRTRVEESISLIEASSSY